MPGGVLENSFLLTDAYVMPLGSYTITYRVDNLHDSWSSEPFTFNVEAVRPRAPSL